MPEKTKENPLGMTDAERARCLARRGAEMALNSDAIRAKAMAHALAHMKEVDDGGRYVRRRFPVHRSDPAAKPGEMIYADEVWDRENPDFGWQRSDSDGEEA